MSFLMDRWRFAFCLGLGVSVTVFLPGCSDETDSEYQSYQELQAEDRSGKDTIPDGDENGEITDVQPLNDQPVEEVAAAERPVEGDVTEATDGISESAEVPNSPPSLTQQPAEQLAPSTPADRENDPLLPELADDAESGPPEDLPWGEPNLAALTDEPVEPREIKLLIPERSLPREGSEGVLRVSYDDINLLDILNMEPVPPNAEEHFPSWLADLAGKRIRIRGFMYPPFQSTGLPMFVLVRDNQECCFGPGAKIYDHILVNMREGVTTDYIQGRAFDVEGNFEIMPEADGDELYQLYVLSDAVVIDK